MWQSVWQAWWANTQPWLAYTQALWWAYTQVWWAYTRAWWAYLEATDGAVVGVEHEHGQCRQLRGAVPPVRAVNHHRRLGFLYRLRHTHRTAQHQLEGRGGGEGGEGGERRDGEGGREGEGEG